LWSVPTQAAVLPLALIEALPSTLFQPLVVRAVAIAQGTQPFLVIPNY
jgi:hypothetical protein